MAKIHSLAVRKARGSMGGMTYSILKGQQIVKEKAVEVSNPRTAAQMDQRVKLANLVALYRVNKPWMTKGAFEIKKVTYSDYNAFISANLAKATAVALTKDEVANGACIVAPVQITKGTLPQVGAAYQTDASNRKGIATDLYLGTDFAANFDQDTTIGELTAALLENNNGLREGDQLSFIFNYQRSGDVPYVVARYYSLVLNSEDNTPLGEWAGDGTSTILAAAQFSGRSDALMVVSGESAFAGCVVVSRLNGSNIEVSSQSFVLSPDAQAFVENYTSSAAVARARRSYGVSGIDFLNPLTSGDGSNSSVELITQILSVGGKSSTSAPQEYGQIASANGMRVVLSSDATVESGVVRYKVMGAGEIQTLSIISSAIVQNGVNVDITTGWSGSENGNKVYGVDLVLENGDTITFNFTPDVIGDDDQTE